jgi:hypothetical protein
MRQLGVQPRGELVLRQRLVRTPGLEVIAVERLTDAVAALE